MAKACNRKGCGLFYFLPKPGTDENIKNLTSDICVGMKALKVRVEKYINSSFIFVSRDTED